MEEVITRSWAGSFPYYYWLLPFPFSSTSCLVVQPCSVLDTDIRVAFERRYGLLIQYMTVDPHGPHGPHDPQQSIQVESSVDLRHARQ